MSILGTTNGPANIDTPFVIVCMDRLGQVCNVDSPCVVCCAQDQMRRLMAQALVEGLDIPLTIPEMLENHDLFFVACEKRGLDIHDIVATPRQMCKIRHTLHWTAYVPINEALGLLISGVIDQRNHESCTFSKEEFVWWIQTRDALRRRYTAQEYIDYVDQYFGTSGYVRNIFPLYRRGDGSISKMYATIEAFWSDLDSNQILHKFLSETEKAWLKEMASST